MHESGYLILSNVEKKTSKPLKRDVSNFQKIQIEYYVVNNAINFLIKH